ncbi:MAG: ABC transporter permease subunit [Bacteriovoracaceae bacterium]|nr:ABC transporter permease subunit [Bacteriovoracaceae bacterium]
MISIRNIKVVFKKEFLQIMRDKSALFTNFFVPLFGLPLYLILILEATSYESAQKDAPIKDDSVFKISYQGDVDQELIEHLSLNKKIELTKVESSATEKEIIDYRNKLKRMLSLEAKINSFKDNIKQEKAVLKENHEDYAKAQADFSETLKLLKDKFSSKADLHMAIFTNEDGIRVTYFFHSEESKVSSAALRLTKKEIKKHEKEMVKTFKETLKIQQKDLEPFYFREVNIDKSPSVFLKIIGGGIGGGILFLLLIATFNPTINTTIGERDQNTFKVLLMNPLSLHEIFIGKYLNVALQGMMTLIPYSIQFLILYAWGNSFFLFDQIPPVSGLKLLTLILTTVSSAMLISSMCFLACSFAKTRVQAQSLITLLMFSIAIPLGTVGVMGVKLSKVTALIPLINTPLATENLMQLTPDYLSIAIGMITNLGASLILIWFSLGAFLVQWKGKSDSKGLSDLLDSKRRKSKFLTPAHAFLAFALAFLGYTYGSLVLSTLKIELLLYLFSPILFCLGTAIFITNYSGLDLSKIIKWKGISRIYAFKLTIAAFSLSLMFNLLLKNSIVLELFKVDFPPIFESNQFVSILGYFLLFAVIPGFVEEILFRGIIFNGFRKQYSFLISTIVSSLLFGIIHFSMFKFGHTFVIGLFLAFVYEKRGLFSCIAFHTLFNSFGLIFGLNDFSSKLIASATPIHCWIIIPSALVLSSFLIVSKKNDPNEIEDRSYKEVA